MITPKQFFPCLAILLLLPFFGLAQKLKVVDETAKANGNKSVQKIYREKGNNHAVICFESSVAGLRIISNANDSIWSTDSDGCKRYYVDIDLTEHKTEIDGVTFITSAPRHREIILRAPEAEDYLLKTGELMPTVYYYKVLLPDKFPVNLSVEKLSSWHSSYSTKGLSNAQASWSVHSTIHGFRLALGGRYGGYFSMRWGEYRPAGQNIDDITFDCDVSKAKYLGMIRKSYVAGTKIGIWNNKIAPVYIYLGGGYGEYGRQWKNTCLILDSKYFHSDYLKGFNGEIGISSVILGIYSISIGADMVIDKGKMSVDYQLGIGISLQRAWFTRKKTK